MPTLVPRLAMLVIGLLDPSGQPAEFPAMAEVDAATAAVFVEADERSFLTGTLRKGDRVTVRDTPRKGWLAIVVPPDSFSWIEQRAIAEEEATGRAKVVVPHAVVRAGRLGSRLPGPPVSKLGADSIVTVVDVPPLTVGAGRSARVWRAIATPRDELRYIRADAVRWIPESEPAATEVRVSFDAPGSSLDGLPADARAAIGQIEAMHRMEVQRPVEQWHLSAVRTSYESLLKKGVDPAVETAIRDRLGIVARHEELAQAAREVAAILERSRRRDADVARLEKRFASSERKERRPYAAEGIVQSSSRLVDGKRVLALIGPEGNAIAYLDVRDGLDASPFMARRVGVRGEPHYSEELRSQLISVSALEPLEMKR